MARIKYLGVTQEEAERLLDYFRFTDPATRGLALKAAATVLEFANEPEQAAALAEVERLVHRPPEAQPGEEER